MKRLLLIVAGHAHAQVLRDWIGAPLPGVELVLVSPSAQAPCSGMVPGWLAGVYGYHDICIDFEALARAGRARLVIDTLAGLDADRRSVRLASGTQLGYDLLSLNVGSTLNPPAPRGHTRVLALRPLGGFRRPVAIDFSPPGLRGGRLRDRPEPLPKAGVDAVRMGPTPTARMRHAVFDTEAKRHDKPPRTELPWRPARHFQTGGAKTRCRRPTSRRWCAT